MLFRVENPTGCPDSEGSTGQSHVTTHVSLFQAALMLLMRLLVALSPYCHNYCGRITPYATPLFSKRPRPGRPGGGSVLPEEPGPLEPLLGPAGGLEPLAPDEACRLVTRTRDADSRLAASTGARTGPGWGGVGGLEPVSPSPPD